MRTYTCVNVYARVSTACDNAQSETLRAPQAGALQAPWQNRNREFLDTSEELYTVAAMVRACTLILICFPNSDVEATRCLCCSCSRWHMALHIGIRRLLSDQLEPFDYEDEEEED